MTAPDLDRLVAELEEKSRRAAPTMQFDFTLAGRPTFTGTPASAAFLLAAANAFPTLISELRRLAGENERLRYYLGLVAGIGGDNETRDATPETAISLAQTYAGIALASQSATEKT